MYRRLVLLARRADACSRDDGTGCGRAITSALIVITWTGPGWA